VELHSIYFNACTIIFQGNKSSEICSFKLRDLKDTINDYRGTLRICGPFKKHDTLRTVDAQKREARETRRAEDFISRG